MVKVKKEVIRSDTKTPKRKPQNKKGDPVYDAYQHYIKSKEFKTLRDRLLERDHYTCRCCGRTLAEIEESGKKISLQAHHLRYENVGKCNDEELQDLTCLCSVCHRSIHSAKSNLNRFKDKHWIIDNINNRNKED